MKPDAAETQMFARLATEPRFREWLEAQLKVEYEIFVNTLDKDYLTRSQGRAGLLQLMVRKLDEAKKAS